MHNVLQTREPISVSTRSTDAGITFNYMEIHHVYTRSHTPTDQCAHHNEDTFPRARAQKPMWHLQITASVIPLWFATKTTVVHHTYQTLKQDQPMRNSEKACLTKNSSSTSCPNGIQRAKRSNVIPQDSRVLIE